MYKLEELVIGMVNIFNKDIEYQYIVVRVIEKYDIFKNFIDVEEEIYGIIFCWICRDIEKLVKMFEKDGYFVDVIYGDFNQLQCDCVMDFF